MLNPNLEAAEPAPGRAGVQAGCLAAGARSGEFTPSGFFRKLFPRLAAAEVSLPAPPACPHFFFAKLELNSCITCPSVF